MTLSIEGSALAEGHRNVQVITADAGGDLGIGPGAPTWSWPPSPPITCSPGTSTPEDRPPA